MKQTCGALLLTAAVLFAGCSSAGSRPPAAEVSQPPATEATSPDGEPTQPPATEATSRDGEPTQPPARGQASIRILANAQQNPRCDEGCSSTITLHDETGAEVGRLDFPDGYVDLQFSTVDYPDRLFVSERRTDSYLENFTSYLVDTATGTIITEFLHEGTFTRWTQLVPASHLAVTGVAVGDSLPVIDLRTGEQFTIASGRRLSQQQHRLAVMLESEIAVYDTRDLTIPAVFLELPLDDADLSFSGKTLGFSPSGDQYGISYVDNATLTARLRVFDLASGNPPRVTEYELPAWGVGWSTDSEVVLLRSGVSDSQLGSHVEYDLLTGATSDPFRSEHGLLDNFGETSRLPWRVAQIDEQITLVNRETGEEVVGPGPGPAGPTLWHTRLDLNAIWIAERNEDLTNGIAIAMIDLNEGRIIWYEDPDFWPNHFFAYEFSADGTKVIVLAEAGPTVTDGRLLVDGEILPLPTAGRVSFCNDDTYIVANPDQTARYRIGSSELITEFGPQYDTICVG